MSINNQFFFPDITLLITHYNRSSSLERLLATFEQISCSFNCIVVSDDGSKPEHLEKLKNLESIYNFRLITTQKNKGLGNNINKGQDAINTPYTLYVQEDFVPNEKLPAKLLDALAFMNERKELDLVRFYAYINFPYLKPFEKGFSEMKFSWFYPGVNKYCMYSDHPHLRRSLFLEKFGRYKEGVNPEAAEYSMMISFLQKKGKALFYNDYKALFEPRNTNDEPSTMKRNFWRQAENPLIAFMRHLFRHLKFNYYYFFK